MQFSGMEAVKMQKINESLSSAHIDARIAHILNKYKSKVLITTSFGTTSVVLLHMISRIKPNFPIHFVDTGFLFPETHVYKEELIRRFGLNIITHKAEFELNQKSRHSELWKTDPDLCCNYNKIQPVERILGDHEVWVSGLIGYQNSFRTGLDILQKRKGVYRFYPIIDWTESQVNEYMEFYALPRHPLEGLGFASVGCTHCTKKGDHRDGRWSGTDKSECGLHT